MQKNIQKIKKRHAIHESVRLGILLAMVGGFLDAYTYVGRGGVFANAQSGNIVLIGINAAKKNWNQALVHIPPIFAFIVGVIVVEMLKKNAPRLFVPDWPRAVLILEAFILFIIGFIPETIPNIFVTVTISFVSSVQISSFRKLVDSPYSTTMSTGNLRSAAEAAYVAFTNKDREAGVRAFRYFLIIISFLFGAFFGGLLTSHMKVRAIWVAVAIMVLALILFTIYEHRKK